jgi:predicted GNAT family N-acyltransferase
MQTHYQIATTLETLQKVFAVRAIVFVEEQGVSYEKEIDGYDYSAVHFLATIGNEPIGTARLQLFKDYVKIGRLAVRKAYRRKGIGKAMVNFILNHIIEMGYKKIKLHAQAYLVKFYEDFGFVKQGEIFLEAGIEHYCMVKIIFEE